MTIAGCCIAALGLLASLFLQSVRLTDEQTLAVAESTDASDEVVKPTSAVRNTWAQRMGLSGKKDPALSS